MRSFTDKFVTLKEYLVLGGCIIFSLILIFSNNTKQIDAIKIFTIDFVGSIQSRLHSYKQYIALKSENKSLRLQNTILALENSRMRAAYLENERLRRLIGFKDRSQFKLVSAKVIGEKVSGFMNDILLDVGKKDSVKKNMPIVLPEGLVGKIYRAELNYSMGHLLIDQNFRVSAKVQQSGISGIISWKGGNFCDLNEIPNRSNVTPGDLIVTSGYSEIFPEGIYIGRVITAENSSRGLFMNIKVRPDFDFNKLEEVLVIINKLQQSKPVQ